VLLRYLTVHKLGAVLIENLLLINCVFLDAVGLGPGLSQPSSYTASLVRAFVFAITFQVVLHLRGAYDFRVRLSWPDFLTRVGQGIYLACLVVMIVHLSVPALMPGMSSPIALFIYLPGMLGTWRILLRLYFGLFTRRTTVLILGTDPLARALAAELVHNSELGFKVCGFLDDDPALLGVSIVNPRVIGSHRDVKRVVDERSVNKIVVGLRERRGRLPIKELLDLKTSGVSIEEATNFYERITGKIAIENLKASWMIFSDGFEVSTRMLLQNQILSLTVSLVLSALLLPILPLVALLIKLDSRGPIFHRQERVGHNGKIFVLWKFRSMRHDAEVDTGPVWSGSSDRRITRMGKILRRTRLDEIPQLYNVLRGDMNLVGPRPERPHFVRQLSEAIPFYNLRHSIKPGVTGWAQINYRYGNSLEDAVEKLQFDLFYIKNMSTLLDIVVLIDTVKTVLVRKGS
jgi:sugar transferase (PEP-CTERM system associated)